MRPNRYRPATFDRAEFGQSFLSRDTDTGLMSVSGDFSSVERQLVLFWPEAPLEGANAIRVLFLRSSSSAWLPCMKSHATQ